jgi:hypothetical protein
MTLTGNNQPDNTSPNRPDDSWENNEVVERLSNFVRKVKDDWQKGWDADNPEQPTPQQSHDQPQEQHELGRRPVYRHEAHRIDHKRKSTDPLTILSALVGGVWQLLIILVVIVACCIGAYDWFTTESVGHMSISGLESMSCSKFNSLGESDQQTVATRIENSQYGTPTTPLGELGDGDSLLSIQYNCQNNPDGTVGAN